LSGGGTGVGGNDDGGAYSVIAQQKDGARDRGVAACIFASSILAG